MANIGVRSPYFVTYTNTSGTPALSSKIQVSIKVTEAEGFVLRYTIIKNNGDDVRLDISEIVRDYINPTYSGTLTTESVGAVTVSLAVSFWSGLDATGTSVFTISPDDDVAYDGYNYFSEGKNNTLPNGALLSESEIWAPENTSGSFYIMSSGVLSVEVYSESTESVNGTTIHRQPCSKYDPVKIVFINKFGVLQEVYFFAKKTDSISVMGDSYKSSKINTDGSYSTSYHQVADFHKNAIRSYIMNTGYIGEAFNTYLQELMLSEQIWMNIDGTVTPVRLRSSSVSYKTSLNDKLVDYTVEFEESNDLINSIR